MKRTLLLICLCAALGAAKEKPREWKSGKLIEVAMEKGTRPVGVINGSANGSTGSLNGIYTHRRDDATYYRIDTDEMTFVVKRTLTHRRDKQLNVTVNRPVKYATDGEDFYLLDDNGKEHKLSIEEKIAKPKPQ
jgi:hypothetical protein